VLEERSGAGEKQHHFEFGLRWVFLFAIVEELLEFPEITLVCKQKIPNEALVFARESHRNEG
jgi:hypothetical protein